MKGSWIFMKLDFSHNRDLNSFIWNLHCETGAGWDVLGRLLCLAECMLKLLQRTQCFRHSGWVAAPATWVRPIVDSLCTRYCGITARSWGCKTSEKWSQPILRGGLRNEWLGSSCAITGPEPFKEQFFAWRRSGGESSELLEDSF